jgi:hypothetical protein
MGRGALFDFGPAVRNDGSEECEGDGPPQVGHHDTVLLERIRRKTQVYGVRVCLAEARFTFLPPSPQSPPSSSPSKTSWAMARRASGRRQTNMGVSSRIKKIKIILYYYYY